MKITKHYYCIDVVLKSSATTFLLGTIKIKLSKKASFLDDLMKPQISNERFLCLSIGNLWFWHR